MGEIEYVDAIGTKRDGTEENLKVPLAHFPTMKMKDIIRNFLGGNFDDEDSVESYALYAMEDFHKWYVQQIYMIKEQQ